MQPGARACTPTLRVDCKDDRPTGCIDELGLESRGPTCSELGLTCAGTSGNPELGACTGRDGKCTSQLPGWLLYAGISCRDGKLEACANARQDAGRLRDARRRFHVRRSERIGVLRPRRRMPGRR